MKKLPLSQQELIAAFRERHDIRALSNEQIEKLSTFQPFVFRMRCQELCAAFMDALPERMKSVIKNILRR